MHVWEWFLRLHNSRTNSGFGANPITQADMYYFFSLEGIEPDNWELDLIRKLDRIALESISKNNRSEDTSKSSKKSKYK